MADRPEVLDKFDVEKWLAVCAESFGLPKKAGRRMGRSKPMPEKVARLKKRRLARARRASFSAAKAGRGLPGFEADTASELSPCHSGTRLENRAQALAMRIARNLREFALRLFRAAGGC